MLNLFILSVIRQVISRENVLSTRATRRANSRRLLKQVGKMIVHHLKMRQTCVSTAKEVCKAPEYIELLRAFNEVYKNYKEIKKEYKLISQDNDSLQQRNESMIREIKSLLVV